MDMKKSDYWFRHDFNARNDEKIERAVMKKTALAKAIYWDLLEMLYSSDGMLPIKETAEMVSFKNHISDLSIASYVILESGLFDIDGDFFYSERVSYELNEMKERRLRNQENGKKGGRPKSEEEPNKNPVGNQEGTQSVTESEPKQNHNNNNNNNDNNNDKDGYNDNSIDNDIDNLPMEIEVVPLITPEDLKDMWNNGRGKRAKVLFLTDERKKKAITRLSEFGSTRDEQEKTILALMEKIRSSSLLQAKSWCNFDWLIKDSTNWVKVMEDKYKNDDIMAGVKDIRDIKDVNKIWEQ